MHRHRRKPATSRPRAADVAACVRCADFGMLSALIILTVADTVLCTVNLYYCKGPPGAFKRP